MVPEVKLEFISLLFLSHICNLISVGITAREGEIKYIPFDLGGVVRQEANRWICMTNVDYLYTGR